MGRYALQNSIGRVYSLDVTTTDRLEKRGKEKKEKIFLCSFPLLFSLFNTYVLVEMADIQEKQQQQDAIAALDEKGMSTEYASKTEIVGDQDNNDEESGPSNLVTRARQSLSDLFTIVYPPNLHVLK